MCHRSVLAIIILFLQSYLCTGLLSQTWGIVAKGRTFDQRQRLSRMILDSTVTDSAVTTELGGYGIVCTFNGFGVDGMQCNMEFKSNAEVIFSGGITSAKPGNWRVVKYSDGREEVEINHPILPEYMFFFDLWKPSVLWRGKLDLNSKKIVDGEVTGEKKILGFIPQSTTVATFTAKIYSPEEALPKRDIPKFSDQKFSPPSDFDDPGDMKRFPEIFALDFQDWWFTVEDAMARGEKPPQRPKPFFVPTGKPREEDDDDASSSAEGSQGKKELRGRKGKGTRGSCKSGGFSG